MMKNKWLRWLIGSAAVMFLLPWAAVAFAKSAAGMAVTLLLFFAVNPTYAIIAGFSAGKNIKKMWSLPVIAALLFLLGAWVFLDMGEIAFVTYAGVYLVIGMASMFVSWWICIKKQRN